uniref:THAP-type domain-containing protein n=1 Tax=Buteo japonicus TaxID=224669 RepID=A0A8C0BUN5_9AVES
AETGLAAAGVATLLISKTQLNFSWVLSVWFFRFPLKDSKRLIQWLKAVQRDNWTPTKYSFLCSEHFTKDSFSKRLEDQHRLLKPTAVPTIFQLVEKKHDNLDYVRSRRKIASQVPLQDGEDPREGGREVVQRTSSSGQDFMVMQGTKEMEEVTLQAEIGSMSEEEENLCSQLDGPQRRTLGDNLTTMLMNFFFFFFFLDYFNLFQVSGKAVVVFSSDVRSTSDLRFHVLHSVLRIYEI